MLVTCFVSFWWLGGRLFGRELFVLFAAGAFRGLSSICVFSYFPFGFGGGMWDLIVSVPDHCLSFYLVSKGHISASYCVVLSMQERLSICYRQNVSAKKAGANFDGI